MNSRKISILVFCLLTGFVIRGEARDTSIHSSANEHLDSAAIVDVDGHSLVVPADSDREQLVVEQLGFNEFQKFLKNRHDFLETLAHWMLHRKSHRAAPRIFGVMAQLKRKLENLSQHAQNSWHHNFGRSPPHANWRIHESKPSIQLGYEMVESFLLEVDKQLWDRAYLLANSKKSYTFLLVATFGGSVYKWGHYVVFGVGVDRRKNLETGQWEFHVFREYEALEHGLLVEANISFRPFVTYGLPDAEIPEGEGASLALPGPLVFRSSPEVVRGGMGLTLGGLKVLAVGVAFVDLTAAGLILTLSEAVTF